MEKEQVGGKKFHMTDAILSVICVVFTAEAVAPAAAIGNSQFFWWILLSITFLFPYGLVTAELGSTYVSEGGIYDWVKKAYGYKWGTRVSWYYWINYPIWMTSLATVIPKTIASVFQIEIGMVSALIIELIFVWVVIIVSFFPVCDNVWILNGAAIIKLVIALTIGCLGVYIAMTKGIANPYTVKSFFPALESSSLSHISVIIFNFLGFDVICTYAKDMKNPKKQIPWAIIVGGLLIAGIYIFSAFGIGVAIPTSEISSSSGLIDALRLMLGQETGVFICTFAILFLLTLFGNTISWAMGINNTVCYAANNGDLPYVFSIRCKKRNMPIGSAVMNGVVATGILLVTPLFKNQDLFWSFFGLNLVMILLSYVPIFPAFYKLRKIDSQRERPFRVNGGPIFLKLLVILPVTMLIISIIFTGIPMDLSSETFTNTLPITIGAILCIMVGEALVHTTQRKR